MENTGKTKYVFRLTKNVKNICINSGGGIFIFLLLLVMLLMNPYCLPGLFRSDNFFQPDGIYSLMLSFLMICVLLGIILLTPHYLRNNKTEEGNEIPANLRIFSLWLPIFLCIMLQTAICIVCALISKHFNVSIFVILFVGVNGVGKTTTIGKLASKIKSDGKKVLMVAGDTFRAGAVEQLDEWAKRVGCTCVKGEDNSDPSSVIYDGIKKAEEEEADVILIDTAGRLQNKINLMKELEKMNKVIGSLIPNAPHETMLVMDATTGQNGISQAKNFKEITDITGIVLTKLDGTAKGGIVLANKEELDIPVKYIGLGEGINDLRVFDIEKYIYGLFKDMM